MKNLLTYLNNNNIIYFNHNKLFIITITNSNHYEYLCSNYKHTQTFLPLSTLPIIEIKL